MNKFSVRDMALVGLFAGLMVVGAKISFMIPVVNIKLTFQLFFVFFAGLLLGAKLGLMSQIVYILLGLIGIPVFSKEVAGLAYLQEPSFGYIIGFALAAFVIGYLVDGLREIKVLFFVVYAFVGFVVAYSFGMVYHYAVLNLIQGKDISFVTVLGWMQPFMVKDIVLMVVAAVTAAKIVPVLRKAGYITRTA